MICEILQKILPQAYGLLREQVVLKMTELKEVNALNDFVRCDNCNTKQIPPCNKQNMLINIGYNIVTLIYHEAYIKQFNGTQLGKGKNCDFMLVDDSGKNYKVAFCDLTCSLAASVEPDMKRTKLPEGKRAKVVAQLEESVHRLTAKEDTQNYLAGFNHRHCVFGWRDPFVSAIPVTAKRGNVEANMMIMGLATSGDEPLLLQNKKIDGLEFVFYQVKYPSVYNW